MAEYPEHEKLHETMELVEFSQRLGDALDGGTKFVLAEWVPAVCVNCEGINYGDIPCRRCNDTGNDPEDKVLALANGGLNRNLAEIFGVDHDRLMDEKDEMLAEIRVAQERTS